MLAGTTDSLIEEQDSVHGSGAFICYPAFRKLSRLYQIRIWIRPSVWPVGEVGFAREQINDVGY